tara:strand:- start:404 stop:991 length:588 start_codon:yes stop_codon:yes gene_type:complete
MIPKLIRLGVATTLKIICETIVIKNIQIVNKNCNLNGIIDELYIKAESIIFNKINIRKVNIKIKDLVLRFPFSKRNIFVDNCNAVIHLRLTQDNINKTLFNKKWKRLKTSIESFISMNFQSIGINNKSIYFISSDGLFNRNIDFSLQYEENSISLVNNINREKLSILNDKNIIIKNIFFCESHIDLELNAKIIFN